MGRYTNTITYRGPSRGITINCEVDNFKLYNLLNAYCIGNDFSDPTGTLAGLEGIVGALREVAGLSPSETHEGASVEGRGLAAKLDAEDDWDHRLSGRKTESESNSRESVSRDVAPNSNKSLAIAGVTFAAGLGFVAAKFLIGAGLAVSLASGGGAALVIIGLALPCVRCIRKRQAASVSKASNS